MMEPKKAKSSASFFFRIAGKNKEAKKKPQKREPTG